MMMVAVAKVMDRNLPIEDDTLALSGVPRVINKIPLQVDWQ
jgi:hypothetical protein